MKFARFWLSSLLVTFLLMPFDLFAKEVALLEQPKADAKVIGKIDLAAGIIPIYSPNKSEWIKVADPKNGSVGWIKTADLQTTSGISSVTFSEHTIDNGKGPVTYHMVQYGDATKQNELMKRMALQQKAMQRMMHDMDDFFRLNTFPMLMPIVLVPHEHQNAVASTKSEKKEVITAVK